MVPTEFLDFFAASAGVAGALIGLLFVAISIAPSPSDAGKRLELDVRAAVAFAALTDALAVSLFALIPGLDLSTPTLVVASAGFATCVGLIVIIVQTRALSQHRRKLRLIGAQGLVYVVQFGTALTLANSPHDQAGVRELAILTVVFFLIGIARAWQLVGARETGLLHVVRELVGSRTREAVAQNAPTDQT